jgi:hypothetical protein
MDQLLLTVNTFTTFFMCGLIWFIQLVQHQSFMFVVRGRYTEFQRFNMFRISWIVPPVMSIKLIAAILLWYQQGLILIRCSRLAFHPPIHAKLEKGFDQILMRLVVLGNWIRPILRSLRAFILLAYVIQPPINRS